MVSGLALIDTFRQPNNNSAVSSRRRATARLWPWGKPMDPTTNHTKVNNMAYPGKTPLSLAVATALGLAVASGDILANGDGGPAPGGGSAAAETLQALKAELERLRQRVEELERQQTETAQAVETQQEQTRHMVTAGDTPGSFKVPGTDTTITVGGYVKLDAIYDVDEDLGDTLFPGAVLTDGEANDEGNVRLHARQSRLFIKTSSPTPMGDLKTHWEGDFFGGGGNEIFSNSNSFRIRHAYGSLGNFLAGQTWTNFMQFIAYPATVDFGGPMGVSFIRQAQARYTWPLAEGATLAVSLENPEATGFAGSTDPAPDVTARLNWENGPVQLQGSAVLRYLEYDDGLDSDSAVGYGVLLAGSYTAGNTTLMLSGIYGEGVGRYVYLANGSPDGSGIGEAFIDNDGSLETIEAWGGVAGISQKWSDTLSSNIVYGISAGNRPEPNSTDALRTLHVNLFWSPVARTTFGIEYSRAEKELATGADGSANRIQFGAQYSF